MGWPAQEFGGGLGQFGAGLDLVVVGLGVFDQGGSGADFAGEQVGGFGGQLRGSDAGQLFNKGGAGLGVDVPGGAGGGFAELDSQVAHLGGGVGEQARDLGFQRAGVHDLAQRGVGGQGKQVAGHVKGAGLEGALVGLGLHGLRAGNTPAQRIKNRVVDALVGAKEVFDGFGIKLGRRGIRAKIRENTSRI